MSAVENLLGEQLVNGQQQAVAVSSISGSGKVIAASGDAVAGLYFSAHWCPPCRQFTPQLAALYSSLKKSRPGLLEVVFVSFDRDEAQWREYFAEMPWLSLPFRDSDRQAIAKSYGINGIPALVLLDAESGETINPNAWTDVAKDPTGSGFPWKK